MICTNRFQVTGTGLAGLITGKPNYIRQLVIGGYIPTEESLLYGMVWTGRGDTTGMVLCINTSLVIGIGLAGLTTGQSTGRGTVAGIGHGTGVVIGITTPDGIGCGVTIGWVLCISSCPVTGPRQDGMTTGRSDGPHGAAGIQRGTWERIGPLLEIGPGCGAGIG